MKNEITNKRKKCIDKLFHSFEIVTEGSYVFVCDLKYDYETKEKCEIVRKCGIDTLQGYYFSKPVPLQEFQLMLKQEAV